MGKKSRKGVSRAGTKHNAAGQGRTSTARGSKSDSFSLASTRASRDVDNVSLDNSEASFAKLLLATTTATTSLGPPPPDVFAFVNNLMMQQAMSTAAQPDNNPSNKENSVAGGILMTEENKKEGFIVAEEDPPVVEPEPLSLVEPTVAETAQHEGTIEVVAQTPVSGPTDCENFVTSVVIASEAVIVEPPNVTDAAPSVAQEETPRIQERASVVPEIVLQDELDAVIVQSDAAVEVKPPVTNDEAPNTPNDKKTDALGKNATSNSTESLEQQPVVIASTVDVWSSNLRAVVGEENTKPVIDVTPLKPSTAATTIQPHTPISTPPTLDTPDKHELNEKQMNECGCIIA